jgi:hypothetical protein
MIAATKTLGDILGSCLVLVLFSTLFWVHQLYKKKTVDVTTTMYVCVVTEQTLFDY